MNEQEKNILMTQYKDFLITIGLSDSEALVYELLLSRGPSSTGRLAKEIKDVKRSNLYNILYSLISKGLVEKVEGEKIAQFRAMPPENLRKVVEARNQEVENSRSTLNNVLSSLKSLYGLTTQKPSVQYLEGIEGLKKVHDDIIKEKGNIYLIRSVYDNKHPEMYKVLRSHIQRQIQEGIRVRAITPFVESLPIDILERDKKRLVERRFVPESKLSLPAQIMIYKNKVAITDLKDTFISTLIENRNIAETFRTVFDYMWDLVESEHSEVLKRVVKRSRENEAREK